MKFQLLAVTAALATMISGCATAPPAVPGANSKKIGDDMYIIQTEAYDFSIARQKVELFDEANAHCAYLGKKVEGAKANQNKGGIWKDFVLDIEYRCVSKS